MKYYIDANIFIYSANPQDPRHESCRRILEKISIHTIEAITSVETFEEIIHYGRKQQVVLITLTLCRKLLRTPLQVVPFNQDLLGTYFKLVKRYEKARIDARDLVHVASALKNGAKIIISADQDFDKIKEVKRIDPKEFLKKTN